MAWTKQARKPPRYSDEFKLRAVALTRLEGINTDEVAAALLLPPTMLARWRRNLREGRIARKPGMRVEPDPELVAELLELRQLRRSYRFLPLPDAVWI